jgi:putative spermidine/putrescine transport system ATP-binding protein
MDTHLELRGIGKRFGTVDALADVNLAVGRGEFVCLLGPSGCGKTTLLRIIAGFEQATDGQLLLDGQEINHVAPHLRGFGMVFQSLALFPHMTVAENIAYGLKLKGVAPAQRKRRVDELLHMVQLPAIADRPVSALSGGQRQRVAIARALAVPPKLFLLDEPLSALDAQLRDSMQVELRQLQQQFGVTTIVVTHDQHEAMMLADRLVVLQGGRVQQCDAPATVYRKPANKFVAEFLGAANLLPGVVRGPNQIEILGRSVAMPTKLANGTNVTLAVRSEDIRFELNPSGTPTRPNGMTGEIDFLRDLGAKSELILKCGEARLRCHGSDAMFQQAQCGQKVEVLFDADRCSVFAD